MSALRIKDLTISSYHNALVSRSTACTEIVNAYLGRINKYNPVLKAIININQDAVRIAHEKDAELHSFAKHAERKKVRNGGDSSVADFLPLLHGVPIILKDTYSTHDMPTTSGVTALRSLTTHRDARVVQSLRNAGAIILGKANLHELSLQGTTTSSLGGQTLNPFDLSRTPGGSSGGTAAALAMNLCMVGCGGDTVNSLRSPASACSVFGFRPSAGQVSRDGIVPVSWTQDVAGPMARNVDDLKKLFDVMKSVDPSDPATIGSKDFASDVSPLQSIFHRQTSLMDRVTALFNNTPPPRIGVLNSYFAPNNTCGDLETEEAHRVKGIARWILHACKLVFPRMEFLRVPSTPELDVSTTGSVRCASLRVSHQHEFLPPV